jgi:hypothetical protein
MAEDIAGEDYDLLYSAGASVAHSSHPEGCEPFHGNSHLSVQTSGYADINLDEFLPLLHRVRTTFSLEFLGPVTDDLLRHLAGLTKILSLKIGYGMVTDAGLRHVAGLTSLRELELPRQGITDSGAAHLARLTELRELNLRDTKVGDAGVAELVGLTALKKLALDRCPVTDRGTVSLARLVNLHTLDLSGTGVGDDGLTSLGSLHALWSLSLDGLSVTDRGAAALASLANLQSLSLRGTRVGSEGAPWLAELPRLCWLTLSDTAITDDALRHLTNCRELINLGLGGTAVTGLGLAHLPAGLAVLDLTRVKLTAEDLVPLRRLNAISTVWLDESLAEECQGLLREMKLGRGQSWTEGIAAFGRLPQCRLCKDVIEEGQPVFCTRPFMPSEPDLFGFARVPMHWGCYAGWEHRPRFARLYFDEQVKWAEGNQFWGIARKDEAVLVSVNPSRYVEEADVILAATGSSIRVPLADWDEWLAGGWLDSCAHEAERDALGEVIPSLRAEFPTVQGLLVAAGIAEEAGQPPHGVESGGALDSIQYEFACQKLAAQAVEKGLTCPHCDRFGSDFRYERVETVSADAPRSRLVCPACEADFGPDDVQA